jgi:hypothetical protein
MKLRKLFNFPESEAAALRKRAEDAKDETEFLELSVRFHIEDYSDKRDHNRRFAFWLKMYSVIVASLTTIILGFASSPLYTGHDATFLHGKGHVYFTLAALILSATVTVVSSWEAFSGYDWKWVRYRSTLADLYELKDDIHIGKLNGSLTEGALNTFYDRLKQILHEVSAEWSRRRALPETQPATTAR